MHPGGGPAGDFARTRRRSQTDRPATRELEASLGLVGLELGRAGRGTSMPPSLALKSPACASMTREGSRVIEQELPAGIVIAAADAARNPDGEDMAKVG